MKFLIHVNNARHQKEHAAAMRAGLLCHGIKAEFVPRRTLRKCDVAIIWGYKTQDFVQKMSAMNVRLLVMERGFFPNRMIWSSLGWDGLNNRSKVPPCPDQGERFQKFWPGLLQPWRDGGETVLICGQVPGDAAIWNLNLDVWSQSVVDQLKAMGEKNIVYRPHPFLTRHGIPIKKPVGALYSTAPYPEDLKSAKCVVTYNSNAGVESVIAGVPTVTLDQGAMAWPVAGHALGEIVKPCRTQWAHELAWRQWQIEEIESGAAWAHVSQLVA